MVANELKEHRETIERLIEIVTPDIEKACQLIRNTIGYGKKIFFAGNGGSAADAQHLAAELTGRFIKERKPLPGIALTTDSSALTAIANDYGYENVFARQLEALAGADDLFIAISTSGNSPNILKAFKLAKAIGFRTIGLTGKEGGLMNDLCDITIKVPSVNTARIQEMHILIGHIFCKAVDDLFD